MEILINHAWWGGRIRFGAELFVRRKELCDFVVFRFWVDVCLRSCANESCVRTE